MNNLRYSAIRGKAPGRMHHAHNGAKIDRGEKLKAFRGLAEFSG
jgi:hypothetical protein